MIEGLKSQIRIGNYQFTIHRFERCIERKISPTDIEDVIISGEVIEHYPEDKYGPSCLIWGKTERGGVLHIHCSVDPVWIITAYDPTLNPEEWDSEFKRRREKP